MSATIKNLPQRKPSCQPLQLPSASKMPAKNSGFPNRKLRENGDSAKEPSSIGSKDNATRPDSISNLSPKFSTRSNAASLSEDAKSGEAPFHRTRIRFSSATVQVDKTKDFSLMGAPNAGAAKVASVVIRAIERQRRDIRPCDRQDICQQVFALLVMFQADLSPECSQIHLTADQMAIMFRTTRHLLGINGGNHDRNRCDSLEEMMENEIDLPAPHMPEESRTLQRMLLAKKLWDAHRQAIRAYGFDGSRQRKRNFRRALQILRWAASHQSGRYAATTSHPAPMSFPSPQARQKAGIRLRSWLSGHCRGELKNERAALATDLMKSMAALA